MIIQMCFTTIALLKSITIPVLFLTCIFVREMNSGFVSLSGNEECPCTFKCTSSPFLSPSSINSSSTYSSSLNNRFLSSSNSSSTYSSSLNNRFPKFTQL